MSYSLSFSPEFFFNEGEPYDGGPEPSQRPTSVWHAVESMRVLEPERWRDLAQDVFGTEPEFLTAETVLERIEATNSCRDLSSPVEVYIDADGWHSVRVYEARHGS